MPPGLAIDSKMAGRLRCVDKQRYPLGSRKTGDILGGIDCADFVVGRHDAEKIAALGQNVPYVVKRDPCFVIDVDPVDRDVPCLAVLCKSVEHRPMLDGGGSHLEPRAGWFVSN